MDLTAPTGAVMEAIDELRESVVSAPVVITEGARTQWAVGGSVTPGLAVRAPTGEIRHDPADLTVTAPAGVTVQELSARLADHGQECPLDPRSDGATLGGVLACGLSGHRRLRHGPLRDRVLEVRVVIADGRMVKGGGPTVKNVSGYDLPRLFVGSLGTLGVIVQATLRCVPRPRTAVWCSASGVDPFELRRRLTRPSCIAWDGERVACLLEGHPDDVAAQLELASLDVTAAPEVGLPDGPYRGRLSVRPRNLAELGAAVATIDGLRWTAEVGVGSVHVAGEDAGPLLLARDAAHRWGGWMLREAGDDDLPPFGRSLPHAAVAGRLKAALDPEGKMNPGKLPS